MFSPPHFIFRCRYGVACIYGKRINELAALKKQRVLTNEEANEQKELREEYLKGFRKNMSAVLDNVDVLKEYNIMHAHMSEGLLERFNSDERVKKIEKRDTHYVLTYEVRQMDEKEIKALIKEHK